MHRLAHILRSCGSEGIWVDTVRAAEQNGLVWSMHVDWKCQPINGQAAQMAEHRSRAPTVIPVKHMDDGIGTGTIQLVIWPRGQGDGHLETYNSGTTIDFFVN